MTDATTRNTRQGTTEGSVSRSQLAEMLLSSGAVELRVQPPYFRFTSGIHSPVYTDNRVLIGKPLARTAVCDGFVDIVQRNGLTPDVVAGTATAGIPHAALLADRLGLPMVYVRGEAKEHGKQKRIEGSLPAGATVVLVEDLVSTAGSVVSAAEALRAAGAKVLHVLAIFSYGFTAAHDRLKTAELPFSALVTFDQLIDEAKRAGRLDGDSESLLRRWSHQPERWPDDAGARPDLAANRAPDPRLIVAADLPDRQAIMTLAQQVSDSAGFLKLNSAFITHGPALVTAVRQLGLAVFLDLKFHDIPNTMVNHVRAAADMGVSLLTIHAGGGRAMMRACSEALASRPADARPRLLAVTALTSLSDHDLAATGVPGGRGPQVSRLAQLARDSGVDGVVCSVAEAAQVRASCGPDFLIVTPGVRPADTAPNEHARVATPAEALAAGADHVVVGRPVYGADSPADAARAIVRQLRSEAQP